MLGRRQFLVAGSIGIAASTVSRVVAQVTKDLIFQYQDAAAKREIERLEKRIGGRLGMALTAADGKIDYSYRGGERFAMCSTFKAPLAFAILSAASEGKIDLKREFALKPDDLVPYAPFAEERLSAGKPVTYLELAKAAVTLSDNAAANLLLRAIGGPEGLTAFIRAAGDTVTRLDRMEPELNENAAGDPRDTSTPEAFSKLFYNLMIGTDRPANWQIVYDWMAASQTGLARIRLGLPYGWPVGNKTGTAGEGLAYNDAAIFWPSFSGYGGDKPRILTVFIDRPTENAAVVERTIAEAAKIAAWIAQRSN